MMNKPPPIAAVVIGAVLVQALLVLAFVVPGHDPKPHAVPVAVVGQAPPDNEAFDFVQVADTQAAQQAIDDREVYGAIDGDELLIASAASPAVAQLLTTAFDEATPRETKPLDPDDPRGTTFNLMLLPLVVVGLPVALLLARFPRGKAIAGAVAFAALAGLTVTAVVAGWLGAIPGSFLALSAIAALLVAAVVLPAVGLVKLLGPPGLALTALIIFFVGNPASGASSAPELLPGFWRAVGPLLPPGAGVTGLRNVAYFDGAALATPLIVLAAFAAAGLALALTARREAEPAASAA